jgi:hypothetical protein
MVKEESSYKQMDVVLNTGVAPLRLSGFGIYVAMGDPVAVMVTVFHLPHYDMFFSIWMLCCPVQLWNA